jgi:hypothetical protein
MAGDILAMFKVLEEHSIPLNDDVLREMKLRQSAMTAAMPDAKGFWSNPSFSQWPGLSYTVVASAKGKRRSEFLKEWYATLQDLRDIGEAVSKPANRPGWVSASAPAGAQADQFLHAHYYERARDGRKTIYAAMFETNKTRWTEALKEAIEWWRKLPAAPSSEAQMLNVTAPSLQSALSEERVRSMGYDDFAGICMGVHAIKDYARRVPNKSVGLPDNGTRYTIADKVAALSKRMWEDSASNGGRVKELIGHVLYNGSGDQLPERLWQGVADAKWSVDGLGISALGEMVGWALPDRFPPRNGRTSKALKSLGYDVTIHVE